MNLHDKSQTALDLVPQPDMRFSRFQRADCNKQALDRVRAFPDWVSPILMIYGPQGAGKTHLGRAFIAEHNGALFKGDIDVHGQLIFVDDAQTVAEDQLFALMNLALNGHTPGLLLAGFAPPPQWDVAMPDLRSRLKNTPAVALLDPDDDLLEPIIRKLFEDRGRFVSRDLVVYLMKHCDRSINAMRGLVMQLDAAALSQKKDMTKSFAAAFLKTI